MDTYLTLDQYKEIINKTKESTSSSPSRLNYGHYKAAYTSTTISSVHLIFMVVPFQLDMPLTK